jgi:putative ABC transport system substrate-binding protein
MRRRDFIGALGAAVAWPLAAGAQSKVTRIGWLTTASSADVSPFFEALRAGLADRGHIEGRNLLPVDLITTDVK